MSAENPYKSPTTLSESTTPLADRVRISNLNHAGVPLAIAFIIGPIVLAGLIWLALHGNAANRQGISATYDNIAVFVVVSVAEVVCCIYSLRVPVLWIEIGPILRYATALAVREVSWGDVQRIWIDREDWNGGFGPFANVTFAKHFVLVIQINDYKDLRVLVPTESRFLIKSIMEQHPRFKLSAFDEEPLTEDTEEIDD